MTFIYILIFSTAYPFTRHTEISVYLTGSSHWWHPDDINSLSKMGKLQFSQIKKFPLIFFLISFFFPSFTFIQYPSGYFISGSLSPLLFWSFFTKSEMGLFVLFSLSVSYLYPSIHLLR